MSWVGIGNTIFRCGGGTNWTTYWATRFTVTKAGAGETTTISLKGIIGAEQVEVQWGDGNSDSLTMDGVLNAVSNTYASAGTYNVVITNLASLEEVSITNANCAGIVLDITAFNRATNLKNFRVDYGTVAGTINGLSHTIEEFQLTASSNMAISGDWTAFNNLKRLNLADQANTCTGVLNSTNNPYLYRVYLNGTGVMSLQVEGLPLTYIEGNGTNKSVNGSIAGLTLLQEICSNMGGMLTGDISGLSATFRYLDIFQNGLTGDITGLTLMTRFRESGTGGSDFSGSIAAWTNICNFGLNSGHVDKLVRLNITTKMCYFRPPDNWQYSAAEMNDLMIDLNANKDVAFPAAYTERYFDFTQNALSAEPTGLGIASMYIVLNYHSPSNDIAYAQWQIITNQAYGPEKVVDGTFDVPASWTFATPPWSIVGGKLYYDDTVYESVIGSLSSAFVSGENYRITFDISELSAGTDAHTDWYDGSWHAIMDVHVRNNTKLYFYFACAANGTGLRFFGLLNSTGSFKMDNLSIKKIL